MKLLTYDNGSGPRCGVLRDDAVVDVTALLGGRRTIRDVGALLDTSDSAVYRVGDALAGNVAAPAVALSDVRLRAPILRPPTVRDYIVYEEHATSQGTREINDVWYRMPVFYFSQSSGHLRPGRGRAYPAASTQLDYELEIGCIIGKSGTNVPASEALQYVAGFCIFNDWSARDLQFDEMAFGLGPAKGKDSASSIGPWIVTTDELMPYIRDGRLDLKAHARVNGDDWAERRRDRQRLVHLGRDHRARRQGQPHRSRRRHRQRHRGRRVGPRVHPQGLRGLPLAGTRRHRGAGGRAHRHPPQHPGPQGRRRPQLRLPAQQPHRHARARHGQRLPLPAHPVDWVQLGI